MSNGTIDLKKHTLAHLATTHIVLVGRSRARSNNEVKSVASHNTISKAHHVEQ